MTTLIKRASHFRERTQVNFSLPEVTYQAIHDAILSGRIKPGDPMRQTELAQELGVSARTVREALSRLVAEGLAESEPHHSVRVAIFSLEDQEELYKMRAVIEGRAFEVAAESISPQDLARLKEIVRLTTENPGLQSVETANHYNQEFHWIVIRASAKHQLIRILDQIWKSMFVYFGEYGMAEEKLEITRQVDTVSHAAIVEALEEHDGKKVRALVEQHIMVAFDYQQAQMREFLAQPLNADKN